MDIKEIRKDFDYLDKEKLGRDIIYLDTAATSQKPRQVIKAVDDYYSYKNANPHRGAHFLSWVATEAYENGRKTIKDFINAASEKEIVYTKTTTEALNLLAYSYGLSNLKKGDEILITILEHHANLVPWQMVANATGAKLVYAYLKDDMSLDYQDLKSKINEKTKIVSVTAASNVTGEITDLKKIIGWAKEVGATTIVDAAQLLAHKKIDVRDIDCDFLVFSGHKLYAPMGIGVLYGKYDLLDKMKAFNLGGDMIEYVYEQESTFAKAPLKFEAGTPNVGGVIGLVAAINYLEDIGYEKIRDHEIRLTDLAFNLLKDIKNIRLIHPRSCEQGSLISFSFEDIHPHDIASILDSKGIAVRSGHHCAMPLHTYLGISSSARASFAIYNTEEEVRALARELENVRKVMGL